MEDRFKIRDSRNKGWFWTNHDYLNGYAKLCGIYATGVYTSLCRHANNSQQSWPSIELMAEELGIGRNSVMRGLKKLASWNIISITKRKDPETKRSLPNIYTLLDKSEWKNKPNSTTQVPVENSEPSSPEEQSQVPEGNCKETNKKETNIYIESIQKVKEEYAKKINSGSLLTDKSRDKIKARLKTYSLQDLLKAIDKFSRSNWWMEHNSARGYAWFFHSDERIDQFLNLKQEKKEEFKYT